jgi:hypothetical protein
MFPSPRHPAKADDGGRCRASEKGSVAGLVQTGETCNWNTASIWRVLRERAPGGTADRRLAGYDMSCTARVGNHQAPAGMERFRQRQFSAQPSKSMASVKQFTLPAMNLPDDRHVCSSKRTTRGGGSVAPTLLRSSVRRSMTVQQALDHGLAERTGILREVSCTRVWRTPAAK